MFSRSVKATRSEQARALPGDELIADPIGAFTHAVTIGRPPSDVWPWLAQMGAGNRAGWYSYDRIDNGGRPSATRIVPELQALTVGLVFPAAPGETNGFVLQAFDPERSMVLVWPAPDGRPLVTWAFLLEEAVSGRGSRLVVRVRARAGYGVLRLPWWVARHLVRVAHFIMQRRQLLGIARRAERAGPAPSRDRAS